MDRWYARRRWIFGALVALLLVDAILYVAWVRRPSARVQVDPAEVKELERDVVVRRAEVDRLHQVQADLPHAQPALDAFVRERLLGEQTGFSKVARELEDVARDAGVRIGHVAYKTELEKKRTEVLRVEMTTSIEGSYEDLLKYLEALERSPHFYLINELSVGSTAKGQIQLDMRLATYFRRSAA